MQSPLYISRFSKILAIFAVLCLAGGLWFSAQNMKALQGDPTATLLPDQQTAVALTSTAAVNLTATALLMLTRYDDFEANTLDTTRWADASDFDCLIEQANGRVNISNFRSTTDLNCILEIRSAPVRLDELRWIEAEFRLMDDHNSLEINQGLEIASNSLSEPIYLFCGINAADILEASFTGEMLVGENRREFYKGTPIEYNKAYTFRLEIALNTSKPAATCFMDEQEIYSVPLDRTAGIEAAEFVRSISSYRAEGAVGTTVIDNVSIP